MFPAWEGAGAALPSLCVGLLVGVEGRVSWLGQVAVLALVVGVKTPHSNPTIQQE